MEGEAVVPRDGFGGISETRVEWDREKRGVTSEWVRVLGFSCVSRSPRSYGYLHTKAENQTRKRPCVFEKPENERDDSPCHRSSRGSRLAERRDRRVWENFRPTKKKEKLRVAGVETGALVSRLSRCLAWSQRPPATRAPRRASRPSRRAPRADPSLRGERISMSAALGASAARRVPTECPPPTTTWSARAIPSFDGVAGSRAVSTTVDARSRRCPSRVTHRVLLVASALASSPRLARTSRAPRVPRRAHAHR